MSPYALEAVHDPVTSEGVGGCTYAETGVTSGFIPVVESVEIVNSVRKLDLVTVWRTERTNQ